MARVPWKAVGAGFLGGVVVGLIVWTQQTHRDRHNLFSEQPWRRLAALGHVGGTSSAQNVRLLRDYVAWEKKPGLR
ncbi:MAG TPA: hypothetical protein VN717_08215, partial [Gemmatimonadaceae bacterium]|nr:hypothetical protein [Gemmatimonadaceae bacterium]